MAYVDLTTRFTYNMETVFGDFNKLANNDAFLKDNGWQDGTMGVFFQAVAPTGWTKNTLIDGRALRVTSGSGGGVAGTNDPASAISLAHTHTISAQGTHTHVLQDHTHHLATSGTDKAAGSAVTKVGTSGGSGQLRLLAGASASSQVAKKNAMTISGGPYTTGAGGSHDHGGATASSLTSISLAYVNVLFCSKDTSSGYTDLTATFVHNIRHVFDYLQSLGLNDAFNYARRTPAGTVSLFGSATAPTGWTKIAGDTGKALRITSGTGGGNGGSTDPASTISLAHTHTVSSDGSHSHTSPAHTHLLSDGSTVPNIDLSSSRFLIVQSSQVKEATGSGIERSTVGASTNSDGSGTTSTDDSHTHVLDSSLGNLQLAYFNVIQASKDSTGAAHSYTDMTTFFVDQALLAYQDLQTMAYNDDYLHYHTMPSAAQMFFFQAAAPLNWTKVTTQNDQLLRIVSDTSGGTPGGTDLISTVSLAHTHGIPIDSHSHTVSHSHAMESTTNTFSTGSAAKWLFGASGSDLYTDSNGGAGDTSLGSTTDTVAATTDTVSHNHGGVTGSSLGALSLAYADVILCSKN